MSNLSFLGQSVVLQPARNADNVLQPLSDAVTPLIIRGHSQGQSGALLRFEDSLGNLLSSVDATGAFTGAGASPSGAVILAPATSARNVVQPVNPNTTALTLKGNAGDGVSYSLFEVEDGTNAPLLRVDGLTGTVFQFGFQAFNATPGANHNAFTSLVSGGRSTGSGNGGAISFQVGQGGQPAGSNLNNTTEVIAIQGHTATGELSFFGVTPVIQQTNGTAAALAAITDPNVKSFLTALSTGLVNFGLFAAPV